MRLDVRAFAIAAGIFWGAFVFIGTWWMIAWFGPSEDLNLIGKLYPGYRVTPLGSLIGVLWAAPDGALGGALLAWLYNRLAGNRSAHA